MRQRKKEGRKERKREDKSLLEKGKKEDELKFSQEVAGRQK